MSTFCITRHNRTVNILCLVTVTFLSTRYLFLYENYVMHHFLQIDILVDYGNTKFFEKLYRLALYLQNVPILDFLLWILMFPFLNYMSKNVLFPISNNLESKIPTAMKHNAAPCCFGLFEISLKYYYKF